MNVALVTVGDEILAGDTVNTNASWLGQRLADRGVSVERVTVVPDRTADIARVVNEYAADYDAVIVTGGLGPTHDDVTMAGVAAAVGRSLERNETALEWLSGDGGYSSEEHAVGTAELPENARPLPNTVGVAPGCVVGSIYVLPGVPSEMKAMFETIESEFTGESRHVGTVVVDEPESALATRLAELQEEFGVKVGSYPGKYVRVKVEHSDADVVEEALEWLRERAETVQR